MNDVINWIAINNTLMIRIGFIAILVLLVVYIFRFFFIPKVNIVDESLESSDMKSNSETDTSNELSSSIEARQAKHYTDQIENLMLEVSKLKDQLSESESMVTDLKAKASVNNGATNDQEAAAEGAEGSAESNATYIINLKDKVESLEARLSEYEIIAEDISEITQLRKENAELKSKVAETEAVHETEDVAIETEAVPETEDVAIETEAVPLDDISTETLLAELETYVNQEAESEAADIADENMEDMADSAIEKDIPQSEKDLIDQFEDIKNKKGS